MAMPATRGGDLTTKRRRGATPASTGRWLTAGATNVKRSIAAEGASVAQMAATGPTGVC